MRKIRVLVVDDDDRFRQRVRTLLSAEPGIEVTGEAADGQEAILKARSLRPDLVLMDVRMSGMNGISATRQLKAEMPAVKVILISLYDLQAYKDAAAKCGADAYVIKTSLLDELIPAIGDVVDVRALKGAEEVGCTAG